MKSAVYLSSIAYALGGRTTLEDVPDSSVRDEAERLRSEGFDSTSVSSQALFALAAEAARKTLESSPTQPNRGLYLSEAHGDPPYEVVNKYLVAIDQEMLPTALLSGAGCGNLAGALELAASIARDNEGLPVLLATADGPQEGAGVLRNSYSVMGHGAASCLVATEPFGDSCFRIRAVEQVADVRHDGWVNGTASLRAAANGIRKSVADALEAAGTTTDQVRHLVTPNYGLSSRRFLALSSSLSADLMRPASPQWYGHCFSADLLVSLDELRADLSDGDIIVALSTGPGRWGAIALECVTTPA